MATMRMSFTINTRAGIWLHYLGEESGIGASDYIEQVLLKHLQQTPGVDLSQSPYSEPKGVSNGKEDR